MRTILCLAVLMLMGAETATAQWRGGKRHRQPSPTVEFGVRGGYDFGDDGGTAGAQIRIPLVPALALVPSGDVFFDDSPTEWQLNVDLMLRPRELGGVYAGAGAAFLNRDVNLLADGKTEVGYNLLAGIDGGGLVDSRLRPFVEARWTVIDDYDAFRLAAGVNIPVR